MSLDESEWGHCAACNKKIESYSKIFDFSYCAGSANAQYVTYINDICLLCFDCGSSLEKISLSILDQEINFNKECLSSNEIYKTDCNLCGDKQDNDYYVMSLTEMQLKYSGMHECSDIYKHIYICNSCNYHLKNIFHNNNEFKIHYNCNGIKFSSETPW